jgi:HK97 family phage major capsid protein
MATWKEQRDELLKKAREIASKAETEERDFTEDEQTEVRDLLGKAKDAGEKAKKADESQALVKEVDELLRPSDGRKLNDEALRGAAGGVGASSKSIGALFAESGQYKALREQFPNGIPDSAKGITMPPVSVGGLKSLVTGSDRDGSAGALLQPQQLGVVSYPSLPLTLRDLITVGQTGTDTIEYAQFLPRTVSGGSTSAAAGVPEATDSSGTSGTKPESAIKLRKKSATVITIAHWLAATKRALSDAAQIRTLIDNFLTEGVEAEIERQVLSGDESSGEEFNGILKTTGVQSQAWDTNLLTTVRKAITTAQGAAAQVTGVLMSPATDEALDLTQDGNQRFYGQGPFGAGPKTIWGVPRVVSHQAPDDTVILGDFRTCTLWDREQASVTVSDSHADFFTRNLVAILAEARCAFGILNPQLLVTAPTADTSGSSTSG